MKANDLIDLAGKALEIGGVCAIVIGVATTTILFLYRDVFRRGSDSYTGYRRSLGRSILIGLEFLVAGDIVRTVAVAPSFRSVGILAIIVLIRTFLSMSLEFEIEGRMPWRRDERSKRTVDGTAVPSQPRSSH
ncbi:MAG: DUF1622 domain-containing protein [Actinomycetota bacterium]|nr:DUF1622 domain-containing protein [Actinomycetota bacterium]